MFIWVFELWKIDVVLTDHCQIYGPPLASHVIWASQSHEVFKSFNNICYLKHSMQMNTLSRPTLIGFSVPLKPPRPKWSVHAV